MQTHFTTLCLWCLCLRCFPNPCQSDIWWLTTAGRNSYQPVLVRIFRNCAIVEAWLPFMACRKMYPWCIEYVSSEHHCQAEVFCSWYMQIVVPLQLLKARPTWLSWSSLMSTPPLSPEVIRSLIMTPTSILNDVILSMETERSAKACCSGEWVLVQVHHHHHLASFVGTVIKTRYPYHRVKLAYHH